VFGAFKEETMRAVALHHDNVAPHWAHSVNDYLQQERVKLLPHLPYRPDLAPCDFFLFPKLKKALGGKRYERVECLARAVQAVVDGIPKEEYYTCFEDWRRRLKLCIEAEGKCFEEMQ
jgi:[histone H3]-lysine36 N-dimethyltransferase SETMAR